MMNLLSWASDFVGGSHILALGTGALSLASGGFLASRGAKIGAIAALVLATAIGSGWASHKLTHNAWMAERAETLLAEAEARREAEKKQTAAAAALETKKETQRVVYRTIYKEADAWVASQPAAACLDPDGVRIANAALGGRAADPAQPDSAVQPADAARRGIVSNGSAQAGGGGPAPQ